ncbi:MAG TPA: ABC transporter permease [Gaiellaceae bacterium]|nr:ABC transporter permease [Gaiellaceae bacterium]
MNGAMTIVGYAIKESVRKKMFLVVLLLTGVFIGLFWLGTNELFQEVDDISPPAGIDATTLVGATTLGLGMFGTLFLGTVLAVFLTLSAVRGDAERGLLQPLVVRPLGRATFLGARFAGAVAVCALYVIAVYGATVAIVQLEGGWEPDRLVAPAVELAVAVSILAGLSLLGSVFLSATANGVAVFMVFGAGLVAGLLGQIGEALDSETLRNLAHDASWILPFEALYQDGLHRLTVDTGGFTGFVLQLGPFGGAQAGGDRLFPWVVAYVALLAVVALAGFARKDL